MKQTLYIKFLILLSGLFLLMSSGLSAQHSSLSERFKDVENVTVSIWNGEEVAHKEQKIHLKLREGISLESVLGQSLLTATVKRPQNVLGWSVLRLDESTDLMETIEQLKAHPDVLEAEPVLVGETGALPNDQDLYRQWALRNTGQAPTNGTAGADISADYAWDITTGSQDVVVAILDTGIPLVQNTTTLSHSDLQNANRIILGPNFADPNDPQGVRDLNGHGTHVAGIVGAETNNATGIAGTSWESELLIIQTNQDNGVYTLPAFLNSVIYASDYAVSSGKKVVINFSSGGPDPSQSYVDAINYAAARDVLIVAITHNDFQSNFIRYPARYASSYSNVMAIGATDHNDVRATYSNAGPQITMTAPGGFGGSGAGDVRNIYSTMPNYPVVMTQQQGYSQNYDYAPGTSMAAPHIAASAALMLSVNPTLSPSELRGRLENTADKVPGMNGQSPTPQYGHGRLNAYEAVKYALPLQYENHAFTSSQTLTEKAHIFGNATLSSGSTLTIAADNVAVIDGTLTRSGSTSAHLVVEGKLIVDSGANLNGIRLTVEEGGEVISRGGVTMDMQNSSIIVRGTADFGGGFTMLKGSLSLRDSGTLSMSNAHLEVFKGGSSGPFAWSGGSIILRGQFNIANSTTTVEDGAPNRWGGIQVLGQQASGSSLYGLTIEHASFGVFVSGSDGISLENLIIEDATYDGIYSQNSSLYTITGAQVYENTRHGLHAEGGWIDSMTGNSFGGNQENGLVFSGSDVIYGSLNRSCFNQEFGIQADKLSDVMLTYGAYAGNEGFNAFDTYQMSVNGVDGSAFTYVDVANSWWGFYPVNSLNDIAIAGNPNMVNWNPAKDNNDFWPQCDNQLYRSSPVLASARQQTDSYTYVAEPRTERQRWISSYRDNPSSAIEALNVQVDERGTQETGSGSWQEITLLEVLIRHERFTEAEILGQLLLGAESEEIATIAASRMFFMYLTGTQDSDGAGSMFTRLRDAGDPGTQDGSYELLMNMYLDTEPQHQRPASSYASSNTREPTISNYPNPFNPTSQIEYTLPDNADVRIDVYNVTGQRVAMLVNGSVTAGTHTVTFDGSRLASGLYLARMQLGSTVIIRNMMLVK